MEKFTLTQVYTFSDVNDGVNGGDDFIDVCFYVGLSLIELFGLDPDSGFQ